MLTILWTIPSWFVLFPSCPLAMRDHPSIWPRGRGDQSGPLSQLQFTDFQSFKKQRRTAHDVIGCAAFPPRCMYAGLFGRAGEHNPR
ncbi:hypothetical protein BDP55DRAFT_195302 [Colletotrichum godetiae]|uniref:Secreted protein n=1 Tax=Colletotrichum godetiae TaxID=1209918 RepID=A0AAJ0EW84_9PEZI|nr:uncharacterized protein BDP55DRAFT_195302 [Colletotrichum godetiae]KAK1673975.1 hypothetical protein BDP55DRAFT_195302 [Colletotrichum godetiae]